MSQFEEMIQKYPDFLNKEEEISLITDLKKYESGIKRNKAQEQLIGSNYRLILGIANGYKAYTQLPVEDLFSAGLQGLVEAINKFNLNFNTRLSTYSVPRIKLHILRLITSFHSQLYIPMHILDKRDKYKKIIESSNVEDTDANLMTELNITERMLGDVKASNECSSISLNSACYVDSDDSDNTVANVIPDTRIRTSSSIYFDKDDRYYLQRAIAGLDKVSKDIITRRYLNPDKEALSDIGKKYNITGERVRQIETKALNLLKGRLKKQSLFNQ